MSRRKDAKAFARWDNEARQWATATGRNLALDLHYNRETAARPYGVGVVLDSGEKVWAEVSVRFNLDWPPLIKPCELAQPSVRTWLVTSARVVGRLIDDQLHGYRWERTVGARVDLTPGREVVSLDIDSEPTLIWAGPAVAPFAVAAVFHLHGAAAMIDHPGLAPLRVPRDASETSPQPASPAILEPPVAPLMVPPLSDKRTAIRFWGYDGPVEARDRIIELGAGIDLARSRTTRQKSRRSTRPPIRHHR